MLHKDCKRLSVHIDGTLVLYLLINADSVLPFQYQWLIRIDVETMLRAGEYCICYNNISQHSPFKQ